ncbi:hypothetical protein ABW19_dt0201929 [Dactylella cylindrospora]|nr:hypothetical protein ABW19_dt0201929 [Dactylella cylindrospora]
MNATVGLRLTSQLLSKSCTCSITGRLLPSRLTSRGVIAPPSVLSPTQIISTQRTIWTTAKPATSNNDYKPSLSPLNILRSISFSRKPPRPSPRTRREERERKAPALPAPPQPNIASPMTISGDEKEPIRYTDYLRPPGSDPSEPIPPPPPSASERATARFISIIGICYLIIHLIFWLPVLSGMSHASDAPTPQDVFQKYVKPWHQFTEKWFTFSPAVALERLGYYVSQGYPPEGQQEEWILKVSQFVLPIFSHSAILHLLFNFFALQALAPTMVRYYGLNRTLISYVVIGSLGLLLELPYDRLLNPFTDFPQPAAFVKYRATDDNVIRKTTKRPPTKEQVDEHYRLGEHCRPALGGSGSLYGFLAITAIVNPGAKFELMFIPVPISVRTLFMGLTAVDLGCIGMRTEAFGTIGHLTGAIGGLLVWLLWLRRVPLPKDIQRALMMRLRRKHMGLAD